MRLYVAGEIISIDGLDFQFVSSFRFPPLAVISIVVELAATDTSPIRKHKNITKAGTSWPSLEPEWHLA
jgi:hypothetical protein